MAKVQRATCRVCRKSKDDCVQEVTSRIDSDRPTFICRTCLEKAGQLTLGQA